MAKKLNTDLDDSSSSSVPGVSNDDSSADDAKVSVNYDMGTIQFSGDESDQEAEEADFQSSKKKLISDEDDPDMAAGWLEETEEDDFLDMDSNYDIDNPEESNY